MFITLYTHRKLNMSNHSRAQNQIEFNTNECNSKGPPYVRVLDLSYQVTGCMLAEIEPTVNASPTSLIIDSVWLTSLICMMHFS